MLSRAEASVSKAQALKAEGKISEEEAQKIDDDYWALLQDRLDMVKQKSLPYKYQEPELAWKALRKLAAPTALKGMLADGQLQALVVWVLQPWCASVKCSSLSVSTT